MKTYRSINSRFLFAISKTLSLAIFFFSAPLSGADESAETANFEAAESLTPLGPPGKIWTSSDGVQHIRDFIVAGPVWGDLNGILTVVANINWDLVTGDGTGFGSAILQVEWNGLVGTFEGRSQWKYSGFKVLTGQFSGHGTGDFEGMQMKANFFDENGGTPLIGTILITHAN